MKRFIASFIVSILILTAPGLPCYVAAATIINQGSVTSAPIGVQGPVGGIATASQLSNISVGLSAIGLRATLSPQTGTPMPVVQGSALPLAAPSAKIDASEAVPMPGSAIGEFNAAPAAGNAQIGSAAAPKLNELLGKKEQFALSADQVGSMSAGAAKASAASIMDRILGIRSAGGTSEDVVAVPQSAQAQSGLASSRAQTSVRQSAVPAAPAAQSRASGSRIVRALATTGARIALAAGAVVGLQALVVALAPAIFGLVPAAAVWAVSSGILILPVALYARYRLSLRDSPRLTKVKWVMDLAIGAFLGAAAIAGPSLAAIVTVKHLVLAGLPLAAIMAGRSLGSAAGMLDGFATWGSLALLPSLLGVAAAGVIGFGPLLGMMTLPAMTTLAFFLGSIIFSAESGRPFSVPGSMQKMRFPSFQWVMTGVVFALLTGLPGLSSMVTNIAFGAWQLLGNKSYSWDKQAPLWKNLVGNLLNFNTLYLGLLAFTAATAFTSPLTFLVVAFAPERAAVWTETLLGKLLPKSQPAPSTVVKPLADPNATVDKPMRWPNFHYWLKTILLIGVEATTGFGMGVAVFGLASLGKDILLAVAISSVSFFFSPQIIKLTMHDTPANDKDDPEFFGVMNNLRGIINAKRADEGRKPIPMPEMVNDPMVAPNAYATGRSPFHAMVGVTAGIKEMLLDTENLRAGIIRLLAVSDPDSKAYKVFRMAIAESIPGVAADATPLQAAEAVRNASVDDIKKLGVRALRGVLSHEFSHVMDRHMLVGAIAGSISSGVAFAADGLMWTVGHIKIEAKKLKNRVFPPKEKPADRLPGGDGRMRLEPISTGVVVKSLPALLRIFAALWAPVILQITQMASSRADEGMADADGAKLSNDPEALALALGLLTTWRPKTLGPAIAAERLPVVAANAHLFTVNPIEQMRRAGVLPKSDPLSDLVVGKQDDFLFNLFVTHPDTMLRIERLYEMAAAKAAGAAK
jgi:Zn-dependent protease with chaperone function